MPHNPYRATTAVTAIQDTRVVDVPAMNDTAALVVESLIENYGQNEQPEITNLPQDPGGQARKPKSSQHGSATAPLWKFYEKKVGPLVLAFCPVKGNTKTTRYITVDRLLS